MAETLVENPVCRACGADIRSEALFCYNCGETVAEADSVEDYKQIENLSNEKFEKEKGKKNRYKKNLKLVEAEKKNVEPIIDLKEEKPNLSEKEEVKLKSAAALRNKTRKLKPKKVEIIWEEHENAPNFWFITVAVLLVIFTVVIYFIAMSLK